MPPSCQILFLDIGTFSNISIHFPCTLLPKNPALSPRNVRLPAVARRLLYREGLLETRTFADLRRVIERFREWFPDIRPRQSIPL